MKYKDTQRCKKLTEYGIDDPLKEDDDNDKRPDTDD
jgi:hypothetical protein